MGYRLEWTVKLDKMSLQLVRRITFLTIEQKLRQKEGHSQRVKSFTWQTPNSCKIVNNIAQI